MLAVFAFAARGWLRGTVGLSYVRDRDLHSVSTFMDESLDSLKPFQELYGVEFKTNPATCVVVGYQFVWATYRCERTASGISTFSDIIVTMPMYEDLKPKALALDEKLSQDGWHHTYGRDLVDGLQGGEARRYGAPIEYYRMSGDIECTLILNGQIITEEKYKLLANLSCERVVEFFGGYKFDH